MIGPNLGKSQTSKHDKIGAYRLKLMNVLSILSKWGQFISSCGRNKVLGNNNTGIRKKITFADSMRVTLILMLPQIILQIVNVSVPSTRMYSTEIENGMYICESATGISLLMVGIVIAVIPFFLSLLLNVKSLGMPDKFREYNEIKASMISSIQIIIITLPVAAMVKEVVQSAYTYLIAASMLSFILPLSYNIAWAKMNSTSTMDDIKRESQSNVSTSEGEDLLLFKKAEDLFITGQMFETMGQLSKALEVDKDILSLFKAKDNDFEWDIGFNTAEVNNIGPKSLGIAVSCLIGAAKLWHNIYLTNMKDMADKRTMAIKICSHALHIFDQAPSKHLLKDRSIIFPGYSFVNMLIRTGAYESPNHQTQEAYESEISKNFLDETIFQQYHYCRALAMQADVMRKQGKYEQAIASIHVMSSIYNPQLHSSVLMKVYTSDHCAEFFAFSIQWLHHLGRIEDATERCEYVISRILPEIKPTELLSLTCLLIPIVRLWKDEGKANAMRALELYGKYIADPINSLGGKGHTIAVLWSPLMMMILKCKALVKKYEGMDDDIAWLLSKTENQAPDSFERAPIRYFDWAWTSILSEACLLLTNLLDENNQLEQETRSQLMKESLRYSDMAERSLKDEDGSINSELAYASHTRIRTEVIRLTARETVNLQCTH